MKMAIVIVSLCVAVTGHALAQTNQNAPVKPVAQPPDVTGHAFYQTNSSPKPLVAAHRDPMKVVLPDPLTTTSGKTYKGIKLLQVYPSYITISYVNEDYAMDLDNVRLENLSTNLQKQFGYDPTNAMLFDAMEDKQAAMLRSPSGMTPAQRRWYDYNSTIERRIAELDAQIKQAEIEEKVRQEMLKERAVEAQEQAARAATIQAFNPPVIIQQQSQ
jgi:hypothetical protein